MNFPFVNSTARPSLWNKHFQEKYNIKSHSLSGSRMVGEAFLKLLSIHVQFDIAYFEGYCSDRLSIYS